MSKQTTPDTRNAASKTGALGIAILIAPAAVIAIANGEPLAGVIMLLAALGLTGVYVYYDDKDKGQPDMPFDAEQIEALSRLTADRIETLVDKQTTTKDGTTTQAESTETNEFAPTAPDRGDTRRE